MFTWSAHSLCRMIWFTSFLTLKVRYSAPAHCICSSRGLSSAQRVSASVPCQTAPTPSFAADFIAACYHISVKNIINQSITNSENFNRQKTLKMFKNVENMLRKTFTKTFQNLSIWGLKFLTSFHL